MITKIELTNLKTPGVKVYDNLQAMNIIRGKNATGKTAILDAITLAMTGAHQCGKTGPAIMGLCAGEELRAAVTTSEGDVLANAWKRQPSGSIKRTEGDAKNAATLIPAERYMEATAKGRFALLATGDSADEATKLEKGVVGLQQELTSERRELKRLEATLKTETLAATKIEAQEIDASIVGVASKLNEDRAVARQIIARAAERQIAEDGAVLPLDPELEAMSDAQLSARIVFLESEIRRLNSELEASPTAEGINAAGTAITLLQDEADQSSAIREQWLKSGEPERREQLLAQEAELRSLISTLKASAAVLSQLGQVEQCPICKGHLEETATADLDRFIATKEDELQSLAKSLHDQSPVPVTEEDVRRSYSALGNAKAVLAQMMEMVAATSDSEKNAKEAAAEHARLSKEAAARMTNTTREEVKTARQTMLKAAEFFEENTADLESLKTFESAKNRIAELSRKIEALKGEVDRITDAKTAAELRYKGLCAEMLASILDSASVFLTGIVAGEIVNYGSDIYIQRGQTLIGWEAMSGSERLAIGAAIKTSISTIKGVLLVDEIGVLTDSAQEQFMQNVVNAITSGAIEQAFVVVPTDDASDVTIEGIA